VASLLFAHCVKSVLRPCASVNVVTALSLFVPVAVTRYCAMSVGEIWKVAVNAPPASLVTLAP